jgi:hypothetical protein
MDCRKKLELEKRPYAAPTIEKREKLAEIAGHPSVSGALPPPPP